MTSKILKSILIVAISVLLITVIVITGVLYQYFGNVQKAQLTDELHLAASATEQLGETYLSTVSSAHYRLTWIAEDGTVLFDTTADAASMENHSQREERRNMVSAAAHDVPTRFWSRRSMKPSVWTTAAFCVSLPAAPPPLFWCLECCSPWRSSHF